jgi:hypothetical protein
MVEAACVPPWQIAKFLPFARQIIADATRRSGDWTQAEIIDGLTEGRMLLWLAIDDRTTARAPAEAPEDGHKRPRVVLGAAVTQLHMTNAGKLCNIVLCGGKDFRRWVGLKDAIETYARVEGCTKVRMSGRRGWARVFRDYRQPYVTLEKML